MLWGGSDDAQHYPRACPHLLAIAARQGQNLAAQDAKMLAVAPMRPAEPPSPLPRVSAVVSKVDHTTPIYFKNYQLFAAATAHPPATATIGTGVISRDGGI